MAELGETTTWLAGGLETMPSSVESSALMKAKPIARYAITEHASLEMSRRGIGQDIIRRILGRPEQRYSVRTGRDVLQSLVQDSKGAIRLVRVFVDIDRDPVEVVTAYETSKIGKYWRQER